MTFVEDLGLRFAPTYVSSADEHQYLVELESSPSPNISLCYPPWKPCIYYSIFKWPSIGDQDFYEINYLSIWDWDTGLFGHMWDTERTALLVRGHAGSTDHSSFKTQEAYYAAHEGELIINSSRYVELSGEGAGATVYWSCKKHASYPSYEDLKNNLFEEFTEPGNSASPKKYTLKNAGTVGDPLFPWVQYKDAWGPDGVSSVYSKLKDRVWSPEPGSSNWHRNLPGGVEAQDEVRKFQRALHLRATGKFNQKLLDNIETLPRNVIRNSSMMDADVLEKVLQLKPAKLTPDQAALITSGKPSGSLAAHKEVEGRVAGISEAAAINLGQLNSKTTIYGVIDPDEKKILDVMTAPIKTLKKSKIKSSDLRELSFKENKKRNLHQ